MSHEISQAIASHPVSTTLATTLMGIPIVDLLNYASSATTLIAGCMGIAVSWFFIQYHRSNIRINEYKLEKMKEDENDQ